MRTNLFSSNYNKTAFIKLWGKDSGFCSNLQVLIKKYFIQCQFSVYFAYLCTEIDDAHIMSKTKEQVNRYLTHCRFPEDDWAKILLYCRKNDLGYAHKSAHPKSESTYEQFIQWFRTGYGSGDVVRYGHTIGILSSYTPDYSAFCVYISYDGELVVSDLQISTDRIMAPAENDAKKIYSQLKLQGLDFDARLARICEKKLPAPHIRIAYQHGGITGYGIIERYDSDVAHFIFGVENGELLQHFDIPLHELATSTIDKHGIAVITNILDDALLRWNPEAYQLEKMRPRVKVGETYWYITDKFSVSSAIENKAPTNDVRYERGNYFINHSDAVDFLVAIQKVRKDMEKE